MSRFAEQSHLSTQLGTCQID